MSEKKQVKQPNAGMSRRKFFKIGAAGAAVGTAAAVTSTRKVVAQTVEKEVKKMDKSERT